MLNNDEYGIGDFNLKLNIGYMWREGVLPISFAYAERSLDGSVFWTLN
jgi:hypothetical protein